MTHYGVDTASFQHPNNAKINWQAAYEYLMAKGNSQPFAIIKITEADNYSNPFALGDIADAVAAGFQVVVYHFVHGDVPAAAQIAWIKEHADGIDKLYLDSEVENGVSPQVYVQLIRDIEAGLQGFIDVYTDDSFLAWLESGGYVPTPGLWLADPSGANPNQDRAITQYGTGTVPGFVGAVDLDSMTDAAFQKLFGTVTTTASTPATSPSTASSGLVSMTGTSDANGNGWMEIDIPISQIIGFFARGPYPPTDGYDNIKIPVMGAQQRVLSNGKTCITWIGAAPSSQFYFWVATR